MQQHIIVGCDVSDNRLVAMIAVDREEPVKRGFPNDEEGRGKMVRELRERAKAAGGAKIIVAYEAGVHGFGLHDFFESAGVQCHVLAPTKMVRSPKQRKNKTDPKDALVILAALRAHLLAGNALPTCWVPDPSLRDDREPVRACLAMSRRRGQVETRIRMFLKRLDLRKPPRVGKRWTRKYAAWLRGLTGPSSPLGDGARTTLASELRQRAMFLEEHAILHRVVAELAETPRYQRAATALQSDKGVGVLTAMVFLTEMGDLERFSNRRQVGAYLGLVCSSNETGETDDRKGHITRQGSPRLRHVLCQAAWSRVRNDRREAAVFERIRGKNPKHKNVAIVAIMRRRGIRMWRRALEAQRGVEPPTASPVPPSRPPGGGRRQPAPPARRNKRAGTSRNKRAETTRKKRAETSRRK